MSTFTRYPECMEKSCRFLFAGKSGKARSSHKMEMKINIAMVYYSGVCPVMSNKQIVIAEYTLVFERVYFLAAHKRIFATS